MSTIKEKISKWVRPEIRALKAYHVPDAANRVKLDAMENPYFWPADVRQEWLEVLRGIALNRYPDPAASALKSHLRTAMDLPPDAEILLGNGSDELIQMIVMAVAQPGAVVLAPSPTFVMYQLISNAAGVKFIGVPLSKNFELDGEAMRTALQQHRPAVVFIANPNNPTGNLFTAEAIDSIVKEAPGLVVVDEAYYPFAGATYCDRLSQHHNVLVMRTLSKLGLAGLRLGALTGDASWLAEIDKLRLPYNINSLTQASAMFFLRRRTVLDEQVAQICADREQLFRDLDALPGIRVWPSRTNFIMFRSEKKPADALFGDVLRRGVLIKNLHGSARALAGCLRVTVGTPQENAAFLDALKQSL
jgi:histidinol-phosphate aminotransferase